MICFSATNALCSQLHGKVAPHTGRIALYAFGRWTDGRWTLCRSSRARPSARAPRAARWGAVNGLLRGGRCGVLGLGQARRDALPEGWLSSGRGVQWGVGAGFRGTRPACT